MSGRTDVTPVTEQLSRSPPPPRFNWNGELPGSTTKMFASPLAFSTTTRSGLCYYGYCSKDCNIKVPFESMSADPLPRLQTVPPETKGWGSTPRPRIEPSLPVEPTPLRSTPSKLSFRQCVRFSFCLTAFRFG